MSIDKTVKKVVGLLVNAQGICLLAYFFVVAILCFVYGLKGITKGESFYDTRGGTLIEDENANTQNSNQAKTIGWIHLLVSLTATITSLGIIVLWTFLHSKLAKKDHHYHTRGHDHRIIPFRKMLLVLGLISLTLFSTLIIIHFVYVPWFTPFFTGTPNYVGEISSLTALALYLITYVIILLSSWLSERCCRESDWYDGGPYGLTEEQKEKDQRVVKTLKVLVFSRRIGVGTAVLAAGISSRMHN